MISRSNVDFDAAGYVVGFLRRGPAAEGSYHYIGVQIARAAAFEGLTAGEPANSIGGVYDALMTTRPGSVRGYVCDAGFDDIGTVADYWRTCGRLMDTGSRVGHGARIDSSARVARSIVWVTIRSSCNFIHTSWWLARIALVNIDVSTETTCWHVSARRRRAPAGLGIAAQRTDRDQCALPSSSTDHAARRPHIRIRRKGKKYGARSPIASIKCCS